MRFSSAFKTYLSERLDDPVVRIEELAHGAHNINYVLECESGKYLLRVYVSSQFDNIDAEFEVLRKLDGDFAPRVFFMDKSREHLEYNYLVEEFIEGEVKKRFGPDLLRLAAQCLKSVHSHVSPAQPVKPVSDWTMEVLESHDPSPYVDGWQELYEQASRAANDLLRERSLQKSSLLHGDPIASNFIIKEDRVVLIDWEFASHGDPFEDLATVIVEDRLSESEEDVFLEAYGVSEKDRRFILAHKIKRCLACIAWRAERIAMLDKGLKHVDETAQEHIYGLREDAQYLSYLIEKSRP